LRVLFKYLRFNPTDPFGEVFMQILNAKFSQYLHRSQDAGFRREILQSNFIVLISHITQTHRSRLLWKVSYIFNNGSAFKYCNTLAFDFIYLLTNTNLKL